MKRILYIAVFVVCPFVFASTVWAQTPCTDTLVRLCDSVCEGMQYNFNGRTLTRSGLYFDTLPRVGTDCDSVVVLRLEVLEYPYAEPGSKVRCGAPSGYDIAVFDDGSGMYFHWTSTPADSSLAGQEHLSSIHVAPSEPTVYSVYVDYRKAPQCPSTGSIELNPVLPVTAQMRVAPNSLTYGQLELEVDDFSIGNRGLQYGVWCGRKWYLNDVLQSCADAHAVFPVKPWMEGDSVVVKMVAFSPTCADSVTRVVPFCRVALYFPNVFTPGLPPNDTFRPVVQGLLQYELWIYDRYGAQVFHTSDAGCSWDGTSRGIPCPPATYVYKCRYRNTDIPAGFQAVSGTVTLLR